MEPVIGAFTPEWTVAETMEALRERVKSMLITYVWVVDGDGRLIGIVTMRDLLFADKHFTLREVMTKDPFVLQAAMPLRDAMKQVLDRHYPVYPVLDAAGRLTGLVRGQAMFEAQAIEISLQAGSMMGVEKEERVATPWHHSLKLRHPWLQLNLLTAFLAAAVVGFFQDTARPPGDPGASSCRCSPGNPGNTGCQALAVTLRGMTLGELKPGRGAAPGVEGSLARLPQRRRRGPRRRRGHVHHGRRAAPGAAVHARVRRIPRDDRRLRGERRLRRAGAAHAEALRLRPGDRFEHLSHHRDRRGEHGNAARARYASGFLDVDHLSRHPAVDDEVLPGDEAGRVGDQERDQLADVLGPPGAADRVCAWSFLESFDFAIQPGLMRFTRTRGPRLMASAWVSATTPPLVAA